eukprot:9481637-Pyramimonas_sp.AAC.2
MSGRRAAQSPDAHVYHPSPSDPVGWGLIAPNTQARASPVAAEGGGGEGAGEVGGSQCNVLDSSVLFLDVGFPRAPCACDGAPHHESGRSGGRRGRR